MVDSRKAKGGDHGNQHTGGKEAKATSVAIAKSASETADKIGTNRGKVESAYRAAGFPVSMP